jgi:hypothetical protein
MDNPEQAAVQLHSIVALVLIELLRWQRKAPQFGTDQLFGSASFKLANRIACCGGAPRDATRVPADTPPGISADCRFPHVLRFPPARQTVVSLRGEWRVSRRWLYHFNSGDIFGAKAARLQGLHKIGALPRFCNEHGIHNPRSETAPDGCSNDNEN